MEHTGPLVENMTSCSNCKQYETMYWEATNKVKGLEQHLSQTQDYDQVSCLKQENSQLNQQVIKLNNRIQKLEDMKQMMESHAVDLVEIIRIEEFLAF